MDDKNIIKLPSQCLFAIVKPNGRRDTIELLGCTFVELYIDLGHYIFSITVTILSKVNDWY